MSTEPADRTVELDADGVVGPDLFRLLALGCVLVMTAAYVSVLQEVTRTVGGTSELRALVVAMLLAATVLARLIRPRTATVGAIAAAAIGFAYYFWTVGVGIAFAIAAIDEILADIALLVTGLPLLRMVAADVWTVGFVPGPVFLSWYLALRGRYDLSVVPGGLALLFLVLTGDAGTPVVLLGTLAAIGAVGFGEFERRGGSVAQADLFAVLVAVIVVLSLTVTVVPGDTAGNGIEAGTQPDTLEGSIDSAGERSAIGGSVDLSPEVRFTVESDEPSYWRTGVYDRFTGEEWIRTGQRTEYDGTLETPPGQYETVTQRVTAETELGVIPTAPHPIALEGDITENADVSAHGQLHPRGPLLVGDSYAVESAVVERNPDDLRAAGTDYPTYAAEYLQTPETTSEAFEQHTADVVDDADSPYEKAAAIETHLRTTKEYSLDVERPDGNVAEEFVFEMDEGYCVYFATAMVQMLRTEDVPARYVTGYTSGQQVDDDTYVVRGLDAHAWVEVYFPGHGWVPFEPTPPSDRNEVHDEWLEDAREDGHDGVDTDESEDVPVSDEDEEESDDEERDEDGNETDDDPIDGNDSVPDENGSDDPSTDGSPGDDGTDDESDDEGVQLPIAITRELLGLGLVALVGLAAGAHRTGARDRFRRSVRRYWQRPSDQPNVDARVAWERLEGVLSRRYRPRRRAESRRAYLEALRAGHDVEARTERVLQAYERATYGHGVDRETADEAIAIVDDVVRDRLPLVGDR